MEDYRTVLKLIEHNDYMATIDIQDAYLLVNVDIEYRKKLRFQWRSQIFEFCVLPFGLCTAPFVYTKLLKPVLYKLRLDGHLSVNYLDDFCCIGSSYKQCVENVTATIKLLESLGFIINLNKSHITPTRSCKFLGYIFDTNNMTLSLPHDKKLRIKEKARMFLKLKKCTIRQFAEFLGYLTSACPAVSYGWLYTKLFEREKYLALGNSENYNKKMFINSNLHDDLMWWITGIEKSFNPIRTDKYDTVIYSDASRTGWGAACDGETAGGNWNASQLQNHINYLELKAAFYALKTFANHLYDCNILLRVDNSTALSYINRMGGVRFTHLNELSREIWQWCEQRNLNIFASYIKSADNVEADRASRDLKIDTEWELADYAFEQIVKSLGSPEFDLFASMQNHKCERYASWKLDPQSEIIDSFTFSWQKIDFYAFPPFCLVTKVLQKIKSDKAEGIIVVPYWPSQPWYPMYQKMITSREIIFEPNKSLLHSPFREVHPLHADLSLVASKVSGRH